jgi:uncharacterized protein YcaQ
MPREPTATVSMERARRLAVMGQLLALPRPRSIQEVVHGLGEVQIDPTSVVARTEHLVLWSRLGRRFRVAELERMLWSEKSLFEYRAHVVPTSDLALHRPAMRRFPMGDSSRHRYVRAWLEANDGFRRHVLSELRRRGPLRTRDLEDRTVEGWRTGGWNDDGNNVAMMLETLWRRGDVMIAGRDGQQRIWDLASRRLPASARSLSSAAIAREMLERQLRARGVATVRDFGWALDSGRPEGWEGALERLVREGTAVPVRIEGLAGERFAHAELLHRTFRGRTVLLSPFDDLISDRTRTESMWGFRYRIEIYVPRAEREYGYFVMPILHGDRLIGRLDPRFDRRTGVLHVNGVWAEPEAPASAGERVAAAVRDLGAWLGAREIVFAGPMPTGWRRALRA